MQPPAAAAADPETRRPRSQQPLAAAVAAAALAAAAAGAAVAALAVARQPAVAVVGSLPTAPIAAHQHDVDISAILL